jgi:acyl carrier protein
MADATFEAVARVLVDTLSVDEQSVTPEASLSEDLGADSLDAVEIIMALETEFDIEVETSQSDGIKTVGDLVELIDSLKA